MPWGVYLLVMVAGLLVGAEPGGQGQRDIESVDALMWGSQSGDQGRRAESVANSEVETLRRENERRATENELLRKENVMLAEKLRIFEEAGQDAGLHGTSGRRLMSTTASPTPLPTPPPTTVTYLEIQVLSELYNATNGAGWISKLDWLNTSDPCGWHGLSCNSGPNAGDTITEIKLKENNVTGTLPESLSYLKDMEKMELKQNALSGTVPTTFGLMSKLRFFKINENDFTGTLPSELGLLSNLKDIDVRDTSFTGHIPSQLGTIEGIGGFFLSSAGFCGDLPSEVAALSSSAHMFQYSDNDIGTPCCEVLPDGYTCSPTPSPTVSMVPTPSPTGCDVGWAYIYYATIDKYICTKCTAGSFSDVGACTHCPVGYYTPTNESAACLAAPYATYVDTVGATEYIYCPRLGQYTFTEGTNSSRFCFDCPAGYAFNESSSQCVICASGHYSRQNNSLSCKACQAGFAAAYAGSTSCTACAVGRYQAKEAADSCDDCPYVYYAPHTGMTNCSSCELSGTYTAKFANDTSGVGECSGAGYCVNCPVGKYNDDYLNGCLDCATGKSSKAGSTECTLCIAGYYYDKTRQDCVECSHGMVCSAGTTLHNLGIKKGFWRVNFHSSSVYECPNHGGACDGMVGMNTSNSSDPYCRKNSQGPYCDICTKKHFRPRRGMPCEKCPNFGDIRTFASLPLQVWILLGFFFVVIMIVSLVNVTPTSTCSMWLIRQYKKMNRLKTKSKIVILFFQITGRFPGQFEVNYPHFYSGISESFSSYFSLNLFNLLPSIECSYPERTDLYFHKLTLYTIGPLAVSGMILMGWFFGRMRIRYRQLDADTTRQQQIALNAASMFMFLLFTFLIFVTASSAVLDTFYQVTFDDDSCYLVNDLTTRCDTTKYQWWKVYAYVFVFVYPLGIPLMYLTMLWTHVKDIDPRLPDGTKGRMDNSRESMMAAVEFRAGNQDLQPYFFLFESYEPEFWWWEPLECVRRLSLTSLNVFMFPGSGLQIFINSVLAILSAKLYSQFAPYIIDSDDLLSETAQWATLFMLQITIAIRFGIFPGSTTVGIALIVLQMGVLGVCVLIVIFTMSTEAAYIKQAMRRPSSSSKAKEDDNELEASHAWDNTTDFTIEDSALGGTPGEEKTSAKGKEPKNADKGPPSPSSAVLGDDFESFTNFVDKIKRQSANLELHQMEQGTNRSRDQHLPPIRLSFSTLIQDMRNSQRNDPERASFDLFTDSVRSLSERTSTSSPKNRGSHL